MEPPISLWGIEVTVYILILRINAFGCQGRHDPDVGCTVWRWHCSYWLAKVTWSGRITNWLSGSRDCGYTTEGDRYEWFVFVPDREEAIDMSAVPVVGFLEPHCFVFLIWLSWMRSPSPRRRETTATTDWWFMFLQWMPFVDISTESLVLS